MLSYRQLCRAIKVQNGPPFNARILAMAHGVQIWGARLYENSVQILGATTLAEAGVSGQPAPQPTGEPDRPAIGARVRARTPPHRALSATQASSMRALTLRGEKQGREASQGHLEHAGHKSANRCYSHSRRHGENRAERDYLPVATQCSEIMSDSSVCGYAALRRCRDTWEGAPCPAWGSSVTAGVTLRYSESVHTTQRPRPSTAGLRHAPARGVCSRGAERRRAAALWWC